MRDRGMEPDLSWQLSKKPATAIRACIGRTEIVGAPGLTHDQQVLLSQTAGYPKAAS